MPAIAEDMLVRGPIQFQIPELLKGKPKTFRQQPGANVSTFGWDTVFAIRPTDLNTAIVAQNTSPTSFHLDSDGTTIDGTFAAWQVTTGASDENINLAVPIPHGQLSFSGQTYNTVNAQAVVQVELHYLPQGNNANTLELRVMQQQNNPVSIVSLTTPGITDPDARYVFQGMLLDWFNANISSFTQVFNTVTLNDLNADGTYPWLVPTRTSYAYYDAVDGNGNPDFANSIFAVLAQTVTPYQELPQEVDQNAIPAGQRAGFLMAPWLYLESGILPSLPDLFVNSTVADFTFDASALEIRNSAQLQLPDISVSGIHYTPYVPTEGLTVSIAGTEIIVDLKQVWIHISAGIDVYVDTTSWQTIELATKSDGTQTLFYSTTRDPYNNHTVHVGKGVIIGTAIAEIISAVISAVVGASVEGKIALKVIAGIITALLLGLTSATAGIFIGVLDGKKDMLPPVDLLVENLQAPFNWPNSQNEFTLTSAALVESVQLGGNPGFGS
jgi:hypothetical protein